MPWAPGWCKRRRRDDGRVRRLAPAGTGYDGSMRASICTVLLLCACASGPRPGAGSPSTAEASSESTDGPRADDADADGDADGRATTTGEGAGEPGDEPGRLELFQILMRLADKPLSDGAHCDGVMDESATATVGDWLAYNLSLLENGTISLPTSCERMTDRWRCMAEFSVVNPDDGVFWRWGVRVDVRAGAALEKTLMCTGAG